MLFLHVVAYLIIYYGAADDKICRADFELDDLFAAMEYFDV